MELRQKFGRPRPGERPSEEIMAAMKKGREETNQKLGEVLSQERRGGPGGFGGQGPRKQ